ncbi:MAG: SIS domain-containing protein [Alphaproteobacteria bacterium]|nr:SIS domain-containing protein [Alphaproteobacteria bacterium]MCD8520022.1 SIS domain-containing protein [Alphaproteobacteria bacterium]MCD8526264.1 SIS domain-containing protein [Alphaproteobacteria bacterium]MCD8570721.1 SIS domain-containing protein [Alphaproteobacteria bacterium]
MVDLKTKKPEFHPPKTPVDALAYWQKTRDSHIASAEALFATQFEAFEKWVTAAEESIKRGNKIIMFGNGGSAADSQHIVAEMSIKLHKERSPIAALSLSLDASAITACANDYGFSEIFSRQIRTLGYEGDIAVGLSTSGNSENVLKGLKKAKRMGMTTVGLTGKSGGKMPPLCDIMLHVDHTDPGRIQEMHIMLGHMFVGVLEQRLGLV